MTRKTSIGKWISLILQLAAIAIIIWGLSSIINNFAIGEVKPDFEYPMANQHIELGWAGCWRE